MIAINEVLGYKTSTNVSKTHAEAMIISHPNKGYEASIRYSVKNGGDIYYFVVREGVSK